jgi:hypothetical protein
MENAMFEYPINPFQYCTQSGARGAEKNVYAHRYHAALNRFKSALLMGKVFRITRKVLGRKRSLFDLNEIKSELHLHASCYSGTQAVSICSIVGSEGKCADFDMGFHPVHEAARQRWVNVAMLYIAHSPLPAVQLIQIGDAFFVRDGHHRISVARTLGQESIDAEVVTWKASPPFPWGRDTAFEHMDVLQQVNLSR